jgi:hypothetical protein
VSCSDASTRPGWIAGFVAALLIASPRVSRACAVCMSGRDDETQTAFLLTTVFLSLLPLAAVGSAAWWLRRRVRELERRAASTAGPPPAAPAPVSGQGRAAEF